MTNNVSIWMCVGAKADIQGHRRSRRCYQKLQGEISLSKDKTQAEILLRGEKTIPACWVFVQFCWTQCGLHVLPGHALLKWWGNKELCYPQTSGWGKTWALVETCLTPYSFIHSLSKAGEHKQHSCFILTHIVLKLFFLSCLTKTKTIYTNLILNNWEIINWQKN